MYNENIFPKLPWFKAGACVVLALLCLVLVSTIQQQPGTPELEKGTSHFVLSSWAFPDEYGQGIYSITPDENSSVYYAHIESAPGFLYSTSENNSFVVDAGCSIRLDVRVLVNYTFLGVSDPDLLNYIRLNVTVLSLGDTIFSIQNMTYDELGGDLGDGIWWYSFKDVLNFLTVEGQTYIATVTYEVWY